MQWRKQSDLMIVSDKGYQINKDIGGTLKPSGCNGASREDIGSFGSGKDAKGACNRHYARMRRAVRRY